MITWLRINKDDIDEHRLIALLAQVELIHAASCILDDVIDADVIRRGIPSFYARSGLPAALMTAMHMISRALENEKRLLRRENGPLASCYDQMILGEAHDVLTGFGRSYAPREALANVLAKTEPLFGAAFWYVGFSITGKDDTFADECMEFGRQLGALYQLANDFHDVFSIGPLVRGNPTDKTTLSFSMPMCCALELGVAEAADVGRQVTRAELQTIYKLWDEHGVGARAEYTLLKAKKTCTEAFPNPEVPIEIHEILTLISEKAFWSYSYEP